MALDLFNLKQGRCVTTQTTHVVEIGRFWPGHGTVTLPRLSRDSHLNHEVFDVLYLVKDVKNFAMDIIGRDSSVTL